MNKKLRAHKFDITDYKIRLWNSTCFIESRFLDCILERSDDNELFCFGLQTNLFNDDKDEKVLKICKEIENKIRELDSYLQQG